MGLQSGIWSLHICGSVCDKDETYRAIKDFQDSDVDEDSFRRQSGDPTEYGWDDEDD